MRVGSLLFFPRSFRPAVFISINLNLWVRWKMALPMLLALVIVWVRVRLSITDVCLNVSAREPKSKIPHLGPSNVQPA